MKTAEQKALEEYPLPKEETESTSFINQETFNSAKRTGYIVGYDQAFSYFMKKAEGFLTGKIVLCFRVSWTEQQTPFLDFNIKDIVEQFKNYMQDE